MNAPDATIPVKTPLSIWPVKADALPKVVTDKISIELISVVTVIARNVLRSIFGSLLDMLKRHSHLYSTIPLASFEGCIE